MTRTTTTPIARAVRHLEHGEWEAAHALVQRESGALACWAHGIVHLVEGDLDNAQYWYRRAHRPLPAHQHRERRDRCAQGIVIAT